MPHQPVRVAAIDIGSNSIRGIVAEISADGSYRIIDDERAQTRLGAALARGDAIPADRIAASVVALEHLQRIATSRGATLIRAVATAAVRTAPNGGAFIDRVRDELGLAIEIVDGETEAHFAFLSASANFALPDPGCIVDIGGGSLEVASVHRGQVTDVFSLPLGAVRLLGEMPPDEDPPSRRTVRELARRARQELETAFQDHTPATTCLIGSGGTITSLVGIAAAARGDDPLSLQGAEVSVEEVDEIVEKLTRMTGRARARIPGLAAYRADTVVPGGIVIREVFALTGATRLVANQRGLREGILLDTIARLGREGAPVSLAASAREFGERCRYDDAHADHVRRNALQLFDAIAPDRAELSVRDRELLEAGAILHDVGYLLGHDKHHRHSWHLVAHAALPGLTARETAIVAALARYHRGSDPKSSHEAWNRIGGGDRDRTLLLAGILRLADGLDRSQLGQVRTLHVEVHDAAVRVAASGDGDLTVDIRGGITKSGLLARALGKPVEVMIG